MLYHFLINFCLTKKWIVNILQVHGLKMMPQIDTAIHDGIHQQIFACWLGYRCRRVLEIFI